MSKHVKKSMSILAVGLIAFAVILVGYNSDIFTKDANKSSFSPSLLKVYSETKGMVKDASTIVEVKVLESNPTEYGEVTFTISKVKIISALKGELKEGDEIKLVETGGISDKGTEITINGISTANIGEHLFLFLDKYEGPVVENAYIPLGAYQGKFKVNDNLKSLVTQQVAKEHKLKDYIELDKDKFKESIKKLLDN